MLDSLLDLLLDSLGDPGSEKPFGGGSMLLVNVSFADSLGPTSCFCLIRLFAFLMSHG